MQLQNYAFCKTTKSSSFWENKLTGPRLLVSAIFITLPPEIPRDIALILSILKFVQRGRVSWIRSISLVHSFLMYLAREVPRNLFFPARLCSYLQHYFRHSRCCHVHHGLCRIVSVVWPHPSRGSCFHYRGCPDCQYSVKGAEYS